jgi:hypothetical protein
MSFVVPLRLAYVVSHWYYSPSTPLSSSLPCLVGDLSSGLVKKGIVTPARPFIYIIHDILRRGIQS